MENQLNGLNIEFVNNMVYYIPKTDVERFDPETNGMYNPYVDGTAYVGMKLVKNLVIVDKKLKKKCFNFKKTLIKLKFKSNKLIL